MSGIWNEHSILYERMKRKLKEHEDSLPKPTVNWDRNAKREKQFAVVPEKKPKAKTKPKKENKNDSKPPNANDIVFEDIECKTPPLSPPIVHQKPPIAKKPSFMAEDDFWDFYEKPLPLP